MQTFTVSDVRMGNGLLPAIAVDEAIAWRITEPLDLSQVRSTFWKSIYKEREESGGPYVTGWINVLFPYLDGASHEGGMVRNQAAFMWPGKAAGRGPTLGSFPCGLSRVPLAWEYLGTIFPMTLQAGFVGISQDRQTCAVRPAIGWAVHPNA